MRLTRSIAPGCDHGRRRGLAPCATGLAALLLNLMVMSGVVSAATFYPGVATNNLPWPGGIVPYLFDSGITPAQQTVYLAGLREWELAANVHFIPRTNQSQYVLLRFFYQQGTNTYVIGNPSVMTIDSLSRAQIGHEAGHLLGLQHEHVRTNRDSFIVVSFTNLVSSGTADGDTIAALYVIDTNSTAIGAYDFESVMHYGRTLFSKDPDHLDVLVPQPPYFQKYYYRIGNLALSPGDRAGAAYLYGSPAPALTNLVTTTADYGFGSLRAAIYYANDHPGTTIRFDIPNSDPGFSNGVYTIYLTGELPPLVTDGTVIDGWTQPGYASKPVIALDGSRVIPEVGLISGLHVFAANCMIRGLAIGHFGNPGVNLLYNFAASNHVEDCFIGLAPDGTDAAPNGYEGVVIDLGAHDNVIGGPNDTHLQRNVISGNTQYGVTITGSNSVRNVVQGNYIGLDASGTRAIGNGIGGVGVWGGSSSNLIGGSSGFSPGNVISGNGLVGVLITDSNTLGNVIQRNLIGTDATGSNAVPNVQHGIGLWGGSRGTTVGGTNSGARNVISGNLQYGILIADPGSGGNTVLGNFIGTDISGRSSITNHDGIGIVSQAQNNIIGGTNNGARNVISGNTGYGILISDPGTTGNQVLGNFLGADLSGTNALPNDTGIGLFGQTKNNVVGGAGAARNLISGNFSQGVLLADANTTGNVIQGNYIGTSTNGTSALPNNGVGIYLLLGPQTNTIGGTSAGAGNLISGNDTDGIRFYGSGTDYNVVQGNFIGTDKSGLAALLNGGDGISFLSGPQFNLVGGNTAAARNLLSANAYEGVYFYQASNNVVAGNFIGTDVSGNAPLGNHASGVTFFGGSQNNLIGGSAPGAGNVIGANAYSGCYFYDPGTSGNLIQGNSIGVGANGSTPLPNGDEGITLLSGASGNVIGLKTDGTGAGNRIAFNNLTGVYVGFPNETDTVGNTIRGNAIYSNVYLGIDLAGGTEDFNSVTANDPGDGDSGPNRLQNYPVITSASASSATTVLSGTFNSSPNRSFLLDFYRNASADPSGWGEGQVYLGSVAVNTDSGGNAIFGFGVAGNFTNQLFTATATDVASGDTSEFSQARATTPAGPAPVFTGLLSRDNAGFHFGLSLQTNRFYRVQTTTNLGTQPVVWVDLTNFLAAASPLQFTDPSATNAPAKFYRAVSP